jgi:hypothetical protein
MFNSITRVLTALANLAENIQALAATVAEANGNLRGRLSMDPAPELPALPSPAAPAALDQADDADDGAPARTKRRRQVA